VGLLHVWLLSPYHTGSHQAWAEGYQRYSQHKIRLLTLAGRFWKWRMQGGAIELAMQVQKGLNQIPPDLEIPDVVLATDMVHLPVWIGLLRNLLPGTLPLVCYMHENQLTYPWRAGEKPDLTYAMINWLSQLTADFVLLTATITSKVGSGHCHDCFDNTQTIVTPNWWLPSARAARLHLWG
jgi:hypothetical protein